MKRKKKKNKTNNLFIIQMVIIFVLLVVIVFVWLFIIKNISDSQTAYVSEKSIRQNNNYEKLFDDQTQVSRPVNPQSTNFDDISVNVNKPRIIPSSATTGRIEIPQAMNSLTPFPDTNKTQVIPSSPKTGRIEIPESMRYKELNKNNRIASANVRRPQMPQQVVRQQMPQQQIPQQQMQPKEEPIPPFHTYRFEYNYSVGLGGKASHLELDFLVPNDMEGIQYISNLSYTKQPSDIYNDSVNTKAKYNVQDLSRGLDVVLTGKAKVRTYDLKLAKRLNQNPKPENNLTKYLKAEPLIESDDPYIKDIAAKIEGNTREEIVKNIISYVQHRLNYNIMNDIGAKEALTRGVGKCSEFSASTIALCRAKNIPARLVNGYLFEHSGSGGRHAWVEVYYDEYGWVMYDPTTISRHAGKIIDKSHDIPDGNFYIAVGRNYFSPGKVSAAGQKISLHSDPYMRAYLEN